jgi:biotin operon repressor
MLKGRPRSHNYAEIVAYAAKNPELSQSAIAKHCGITQSMVSRILRVSGVEVDPHQRRGRSLVRKSGQTDLEHKWEAILHREGLGMDRGLRLHGQRIFFGFDPLKATFNDRSATLVAA